jgi:rhodanese-related sulfurtransferase
MASMAKTAAQMIAEARARTENLTPQQVAKEQAGGAIVIDVREPNERVETGVIPGSIAAPRGMLEFYADSSSAYHNPALDPNKRVILHCAAGGRSALAADTLKELGYTNVAHLEGGLNAWKAEGLPIVPETSK